MTSQSTYRELAPKHAARKVPVPQGREYQREAARLGSRTGGDAICRAAVRAYAYRSITAMSWVFGQGRQLDGAHSAYASYTPHT